ncbi:MAG: glycosyltransferase family 2 protein [Candidatus Omnitrophota bacterium]|jgi:glycosyltransferase involved in cell wall biosynthesis
MKICAIIPAFNEASTIGLVVEGVKRFGVDAIVIDDGSSDNTYIAASRAGAYVIRNARRSGKGLALRSGFDYSLSRGYELFFTMDADGQHDPDDIPRFLDKIKDCCCCVIIGNRMDDPRGMPPIRVITNTFMSRVISVLSRQRVLDTQCGYRLFTRDAISAIDMRSRKFEIESEMLIKIARKGFRIGSVPVKSIYAGETSKIRPIRDTFRFIRFIITHMIIRK